MHNIKSIIKEKGFNYRTINTILLNNRYSNKIKNFYLIILQKITSNYSYNPDRYDGSFINKIPYSPNPPFKKAEEIIYCFWTGNNPMSENRKRGLNSIVKNTNVKVQLITPENLEDFILIDAPLHKAYKNLSLVHKSDYLRCYFMHHYGGGYVDIKEVFEDWRPFFTRLNEYPNKVIIGSTESSFQGIAHVNGTIRKDLERNYLKVISTQAFICRPQTMFTTEWYEELLRRMSYYQGLLKNNPGNDRGTNEGYPIPWTNILGDIYHPLCLKYHNFILHDRNMHPYNINYL